MLAVLVSGLLECSDIKGIVETVRADKNLSPEIKTELVEILTLGSAASPEVKTISCLSSRTPPNP